jgi:hypothetical protein
LDTGVWSTWYDLAPGSEGDYLPWLHGDYIPWLKQQPGIAWIAHYRATGGGPAMQQLLATAPHADEPMPGGGDYILLVGAATVHAFWNPYILELPMPSGFDQMLMHRREARLEFYTEEARVDGASSLNRLNGATAAPAIQFGTYRMRTTEAEFFLGQFNTQSRFPAMAAMPGSVRVRKLVSVAGWPKHGVLYEFDSLEARLKHHEEGLECQTLDPSTWTGRNTKNAIYAPKSPFVGERIWPPIAKLQEETV